jgi:hypothetical protein
MISYYSHYFRDNENKKHNIAIHGRIEKDAGEKQRASQSKIIIYFKLQLPAGCCGTRLGRYHFHGRIGLT